MIAQLRFHFGNPAKQPRILLGLAFDHFELQPSFTNFAQRAERFCAHQLRCDIAGSGFQHPIDMGKHAIPIILHLTRPAQYQQRLPMLRRVCQQLGANRFCSLRLALTKQPVGFLEKTLEIGTHLQPCGEATIM
nr:hypothetical protein [Parasphingorhabdus sp.]